MGSRPDREFTDRYLKPSLKWGLPPVLLIVFLIAFRRQVATAVSPFLVAFVLAYVLDPVVSYLQEGRLPVRRLGAVLILYVAIIAVIATATAVVVPRLVIEVQDLAAQVYVRYGPKLQRTIEGWLGDSEASRTEQELSPGSSGKDEERPAASATADVSSATSEGATTGEKIIDAFEDPENRGYINRIAGWAESLLSSLRDLFLGLVGSFANFFRSLMNLLLSLVILFYLLLDYADFKKKVKSLIPEKSAPDVLRILGAIDRQLSAYLRGQVTISIIIGVLVAAGLWVVGMALSLSVAKYALLIGVTAGLFNLVPYLGPVMGATPAVLLTAIDVYDPGTEGYWIPMLIQVGVVVALFVLIQVLDGFVISPRVMGNRLELHPLVIMFVLILGGTTGGFIGMILAVPLTCVLRILAVEFYMRGKQTEGGEA